METISTLETPGLTGIRRNGNTIRQVDFAIQKIFEGFEVYLQDHHEKGGHSIANEKLAQDVQRRIKSEHWWLNQDGNILFYKKKGFYSVRISEKGIKNQRIYPV